MQNWLIFILTIIGISSGVLPVVEAHEVEYDASVGMTTNSIGEEVPRSWTLSSVLTGSWWFDEQLRASTSVGAIGQFLTSSQGESLEDRRGVMLVTQPYLEIGYRRDHQHAKWDLGAGAVVPGRLRQLGQQESLTPSMSHILVERAQVMRGYWKPWLRTVSGRPAIAVNSTYEHQVDDLNGVHAAGGAATWISRSHNSGIRTYVLQGGVGITHQASDRVELRGRGLMVAKISTLGDFDAEERNWHSEYWGSAEALARVQRGRQTYSLRLNILLTQPLPGGLGGLHSRWGLHAGIGGRY